MKDAAGSGDWTTAGLINCLGRCRASRFAQLDERALSTAFKQAQAMAAWNCQYEGARGGMYASSRASLETFVASALDRTLVAIEKREKLPKLVSRALELCPDCTPVKGRIAEALSDTQSRRDRREAKISRHHTTRIR